MTVIIGLTGGIGSGKSTVSKEFAQLGISIVDADIVAREVVAKGQPALQKIAQHFGEHIIVSGELDRAVLREIIFNNETEKEWLNNLLHPLIRAEMINQLSQAIGPYVIFEAPLLFENNLQQLCDVVLVIDIAPELQVSRASKRDGLSQESIKAVINSQIERHLRVEQANYVIDNSQLTVGQLQVEVTKLHKQFIDLSN